VAGGLVVGMVSTRFAGTDGVTLEAAKLAEVLAGAGYRVAWFAGELGERFQPGRLHPPAHFESEANRALEAACFGVATRSPATTALIRERTEELKGALRGFLGDFGVGLVVAQNVLCLPMQLPLGLALTEVLVEEGLPLLAHHHDFWWERERFFPNAAADVLGAAFPPVLERAAHLVINSAAARELARRRAVEATVLPNVMDFERGPRRPGDPARYREAAGLAPDQVLLLQPTRVVPRKWIEATVELAARLPAAGGPPVTVAVTHAEGDEGRGYGERLRALARARRVDLRFVPAGDGTAGGPGLAGHGVLVAQRRRRGSMPHARHQLAGARPGRDRQRRGGVAQVVEAQPLDADRPGRWRPHPPGEVAAPQRPATRGREHQPVRPRLGVGGQVLGQRLSRDGRQRDRAQPGGGLGRRDRERAPHLGELLGHGDLAVQQVHALGPQAGQLPQRSPV
jgi:mannosylglucosylglycerate synthase